MKQKAIQLLLFILGLTLLSSCLQNNEISKTKWQMDNEEFFEEQAKNPKYEKISYPGSGKKAYVLVHKIKKGDTKGKRPLSDSKIAFKQSLRLYTGELMDSNLEQERPSELYLSGTIIGYSMALQHMVEGDVWEVIIPWYLGYGAYERGGIPAHSALCFTIELHKVY